MLASTATDHCEEPCTTTRPSRRIASTCGFAADQRDGDARGARASHRSTRRRRRRRARRRNVAGGAEGMLGSCADSTANACHSKRLSGNAAGREVLARPAESNACTWLASAMTPSVRASRRSARRMVARRARGALQSPMYAPLRPPTAVRSTACWRSSRACCCSACSRKPAARHPAPGREGRAAHERALLLPAVACDECALLAGASGAASGRARVGVGPASRPRRCRSRSTPASRSPHRGATPPAHLRNAPSRTSVRCRRMSRRQRSFTFEERSMDPRIWKAVALASALC